MDDTPFEVTDSQYSALKRLRDPQEVTIWWLDVVCINQDDPVERAEQVSIMHEIYAKSLETQIWLGEPDSTWIGYLDGNELQNLFSKFMVQSDLISKRNLEMYEGSREYFRKLLSKEGNDTWSAIEGAITVAKILASRPNLLELPFYYRRDTGSLSPYWQWYFHFGTFAYIMTRPWWSRLWIAEEILFGKSPPVLRLGSLTVPLKIFTDALGWLRNTYESAASHELTLLDWCTHTRADIPFDMSVCGGPFYSWMSSYKRQYYTLETLLNMSESMEVTDPRDRIFALSGFQDPALRVPISYTLPVSWLYPYITWRLCIARNSLDWLAQFRLTSHDNSNAGLPSWTTDFNSPSSSHKLWFRSNTLCDEPDWSITTMATDDRLRVVVNPLETITACIDPFWNEEDTPGKQQEVNPSPKTSDSTVTTLLAPALREVHMSGFSQTDFLHTLLGDMSILPRRLRDTRTDWEVLDLCTRALRSELKPSQPLDKSFNSRDLAVLRAIKTQLRGARMFITSEWKLGIGPVAAEVGDVLYHIHGCAAPVILRPAWPGVGGVAEDVDDCYSILGAAYVEGLIGAAAVDKDRAMTIQLV